MQIKKKTKGLKKHLFLNVQNILAKLTDLYFGFLFYELL